MSLFSCCKPIVAPAKTPASEDSGPADGLRHSSSFLDADLHRTKSESRILQAPLPVSPDGKSLSSSARSLFEASAYRVAAHEYREKIKQNQPDTDNGGLPARFLELYLTALKAGNTKWATTPEVGALFTDNAKLISQDKQITIGKSAILRRLDQGIEMVIKMAGKDAAMPEWEVQGPSLTESLTHEYKVTIKRGPMKYSFAMDFLIMGGKIQQLQNRRL